MTCEELYDKPKVLVLQACRGNDLLEQGMVASSIQFEDMATNDQTSFMNCEARVSK